MVIKEKSSLKEKILSPSPLLNDIIYKKKIAPFFELARFFLFTGARNPVIAPSPETADSSPFLNESDSLYSSLLASRVTRILNESDSMPD